MVVIVSSTAIVQAERTSDSTNQIQFGGVEGSTNQLAKQGPTMSTHQLSSFLVGNANFVLQGAGAQQTGFILNPDRHELEEDLQILVFFPDFVRSTNLFSIIGTAETVEKFFDRSPFFFSPHETDPNTLRDLSEAQQLLVYSSASIFSYDNFKNTLSSAQLISAKGSVFKGTNVSTNIVSNGGFENGLAGWDSFKGHTSDIVQVRSTQPTGVGFNDASPVLPPEGTFWAYLAAVETAAQVYIKQRITATSNTGFLLSGVLDTFKFTIVLNQISGARLFQANLIFYYRDLIQRNLIYRLNTLGIPTPLPGDTGLSPSTITTISPTPLQDVITSYSRNLQADLAGQDFPFDRVEIWFIADTTNNLAPATRILLDDIQLNVSAPPEQLSLTTNYAHVVTTLPTASGIPLVVSGSTSINQNDIFGPVFSDQDPAPGSTFNPQNSLVNFHVKDFLSPLNPGSINVFIDNVHLITNGSITLASPWAAGVQSVISSSERAYQFTRSTPFAQQSTVTVSGIFSDLAQVSNQSTQVYTFLIVGSGSLTATISGLADSIPPTITAIDPAPLDTQISPNTAIVWTTADNAAGVDLTKTQLYLNGKLVVNNDVGIDGTMERTANNNLGFDYTYLPDQPFNFGQTVTGTIIAADFSTTGPNTGTLTYTFTTTPSDSLQITNFFMPVIGDSILLTSGTLASLDVVDLVYGVASGTTTVKVNGHTIPGLQTTASGSGPDRLHFEFSLQPEVDFRTDINIEVHAENKIPGNYPVIKEKTFVLKPGYDVHWYNRSPDLSGGYEKTFPYLSNVQVLTEAKNFAKTFSEGAAFFEVLVENQAAANLGAFIESNIKTADLPATLVPLNTFFSYGKEIVLEFSVMDLEGNALSFTHTFTIEERT